MHTMKSEGHTGGSSRSRWSSVHSSSLAGATDAGSSPDGYGKALGAPTSRLLYGSLIALSLMVWGLPLLAPQSMYWDDWVVLLDPIGIYHDIGLPWVGYLVTWLTGGGPWLLKTLTLIAAVFSACAVYGIAGARLRLRPSERWWVAALATVLPFYVLRISVLAVDVYGLSLAAFLGAWWLLVRDSADPPRHGRAAVAAVLFFASFTTQSLLLFLILPFVHFLVLFADRTRGLLRGCLALAGRHWYLIASPVSFWALKSLFFRPSGPYADYYNSFVDFKPPLTVAERGAVAAALAALGAAAVLAVLAFPRLAVRHTALALLSVGLGAAIIGIAVAQYVVRPIDQFALSLVTALLLGSGLVLAAGAAVAALSRRFGDLKRATTLGAIGLLTIALGALPYLVVDKVPVFVSFETRHQLLLPFGVALVVVAAVVALEPVISRWPRMILVGAIVLSCALVSATNALALVADWRKQEQIIALLRDSPDVSRASVVIVTDNVSHLGFDSRAYTYYEVNGWLRAAFGDQRRLGLTASEVPAVLAGGRVDFTLGTRYGFADWEPGGDAVSVTVSSAAGASWWTLLIGTESVTVEVAESTIAVEPEHGPFP